MKMAILKKFRRGWAALVRRNRAERELADELRFHLERQTEINIAAGMSAAEARDRARRDFGGPEQIKEECREARGVHMIENFLQDLRYGLRTLARTPGFAAVSILTLMLGIGANTAIFSVVNAVLLRPLPFPDSDRLVMVWSTNTKSGDTEDVGSYPDYADWKARSQSFSAMAAFASRSVTLAGEQAELVRADRVAPGFFELLGIAPEQGRTFRPEEQEAGASGVALISEAFWKSHFAGRPDILGQTLRLEADWLVDHSQTFTIIGVMPPGFNISGPEGEPIYIPFVPDPDRGHGFLQVIARLKRGVNVSHAQAEMNIITGRLAREYPKDDSTVGANVQPLADALAGKVRMGLFVFLGVVALVLLIACTNVANLMLARSAARQKELAVRAALGAGRVRMVQQLLTESTVLALAGGLLGLALAAWSAPILARVLAKNFNIPRIETTRTDLWVLGFALALSLLTGIVFGILPALAASSPDLNQDLRESGRSASGGLRGRRVRGLLVISETAMALILLAGAGLLLKSMLVMRSTAPGFETLSLLTADFWVPRARFSTPLARMEYFQNVLARVNSTPGVRSAALVADLPLGGGSDGLGFHIVGRPDPAPGEMFDSQFNIASPGYFQTMGIPIRAGREFSAQDSAATPSVIVINQTAAKKFWPAENPIGRQIALPVSKNATAILTVIGVAGDVRQRSLGAAPQPEIFVDFLQPGPPWPWLVLVARVSGDPQAMKTNLRAAAGSVDAGVPFLRVRSMDEVLASTLAQPGVFTLLLGIFASLAVALAAVGLYGVVSYTVTQRMHEMGIRVALGARRSDLLRLVLRHGLVLTVLGIAVGLGGAIAFMRVLNNLIPGVQAVDALTLSFVCALMLGVALAACILPARRATRVDPVIALRYE